MLRRRENSLLVRRLFLFMGSVAKYLLNVHAITITLEMHVDLCMFRHGKRVGVCVFRYCKRVCMFYSFSRVFLFRHFERVDM